MLVADTAGLGLLVLMSNSSISYDHHHRSDVRIYLTESMGGVLGANVMRDHNVVFDYDNHVVGFAEGVCDYRADALDSSPGDKATKVFFGHH